MVNPHMLVPRALWRSESALRFRRCGNAIRLCEEFGLSERVCTTCTVDDRTATPPLRRVA